MGSHFENGHLLLSQLVHTDAMLCVYQARGCNFYGASCTDVDGNNCRARARVHVLEEDRLRLKECTELHQWVGRR